MDGATESRNGKILLSIIENTPYTDPPQSRIEELLIELKEIIEAGGGGGTTSYEGLTGKPKINGYTLSGDVSLSDIGAASENALAAKQDTIADISAIRSGAAAGATAVQPAEFETDQQRQETEIGAVANAGAKNWQKLNVKSKTVDGVTYTLQSDGCIVANGIAAASSVVASFYGGQFTLPAGDWLLNGCPSGGSTASYMVQIKDNSNPENPAAGTVLYRDFGTGDVLISINTETTFMYVIRVANGYTVNNVMFKPMIRPASITDDTFVPYAPTNRELYEMILALQSGGASTQSTAALMGAKSTIDHDVITEEGEKQDE